MRTAGAEVLTDTGRQTVATGAGLARETYDRLRFVQLEDFVDGQALTDIIGSLMPEVRRYAARIIRPHEVSAGLLYEGRRFSRIDPGVFEGADTRPDHRAATQAIFDGSGLTAFIGSLLAEALPFFEDVTSHRLRFDRVFLLSYGEGDFIAPHGDTQTSQRVMIQMPVTFHCRCAMRVMRDGWMEPYYDNAGALRLHGPGIWHEVLPVLRLRDDADPERVLITARLAYADNG
jgi:hypothetical protein